MTGEWGLEKSKVKSQKSKVKKGLGLEKRKEGSGEVGEWESREVGKWGSGGVPDFKVLEFNYRVIQLNRLNWRDFLRYQNPAASALMAKMKIAPCDRQRLQPATDSNRWLIAKARLGFEPQAGVGDD